VKAWFWDAEDPFYLDPFAGDANTGPPRLPGEYVTDIKLRRRLLAFATSAGESSEGKFEPMMLFCM
jgi:hypothetical protein